MSNMINNFMCGGEEEEERTRTGERVGGRRGGEGGVVGSKVSLLEGEGGDEEEE